MSLVEVLVGMLVLLLGLVGVFDVIANGGRAVAAGTRSLAMAQVGEQTLQSVEALSYANIADSSAPVNTTTTDSTNPTYYIFSCTGGTCYQWDSSTRTTAEVVAVDATYGKVAPGTTNVVVPAPAGAGPCTIANPTGCQMTFAVHVFVTNSTDAICSQSGVTCASTTSYKRITVAVKNTGPAAPLKPLYLSTFVTNKSGGAGNPLTSSNTTCLDGTTTVPCVH